MSTLSTIKTQIQTLINNANTTTGNTDTNLTDSVNALISGYGQGDVEPLVRVQVLAPKDSEVICVLSDTNKLHDKYSDGIWFFDFEKHGEYMFKATKGDWSNSITVVTYGKSICLVDLNQINTTLESNTWEEIIEASNNNTVPESWLGQLKPLTLSTGEIMNMQVAGINHDNLSDGSGKAKITFISKNIMKSYKAIGSYSNNGGWNGDNSLRTWCNSTIYNMIPDPVKTAIKAVDKISNSDDGTLFTTSDLCWLPSGTEIQGDEWFYNAGIGDLMTVQGQGEKYPIFVSSASRKKYKLDGTLYHWWTRSCCHTSGERWIFVSNWGSCSYDTAGNAFGIAFGFCI